MKHTIYIKPTQSGEKGGGTMVRIKRLKNKSRPACILLTEDKNINAIDTMEKMKSEGVLPIDRETMITVNKRYLSKKVKFGPNHRDKITLFEKAFFEDKRPVCAIATYKTIEKINKIIPVLSVYRNYEKIDVDLDEGDRWGLNRKVNNKITKRDATFVSLEPFVNNLSYITATPGSLAEEEINFDSTNNVTDEDIPNYRGYHHYDFNTVHQNEINYLKNEINTYRNKLLSDNFNSWLDKDQKLVRIINLSRFRYHHHAIYHNLTTHLLDKNKSYLIALVHGDAEYKGVKCMVNQGRGYESIELDTEIDSPEAIRNIANRYNITKIILIGGDKLSRGSSWSWNGWLCYEILYDRQARETNIVQDVGRIHNLAGINPIIICTDKMEREIRASHIANDLYKDLILLNPKHKERHKALKNTVFPDAAKLTQVNGYKAFSVELDTVKDSFCFFLKYPKGKIISEMSAANLPDNIIDIEKRQQKEIEEGTRERRRNFKFEAFITKHYGEYKDIIVFRTPYNLAINNLKDTIKKATGKIIYSYIDIKNKTACICIIEKSSDLETDTGFYDPVTREILVLTHNKQGLKR